MTFKKILMVHKKNAVLERLGRTLENLGHSIVTAEEGKTALERYAKEHPQAVIASTDIADLGIFELCREIKRNPTQTTRIMVIAREEDRGVRTRLTEAGADELLSERCTLPVLVEHINELLYSANGTQPKDLAGSIAGSGLIDVLQLIELSAKSGVLHVTTGTRNGAMTLSYGQLLEANTEKSKDEEAVYEMLSWQEGEFSFQTQEVEASKPILASISSLVLEWARTSDEDLGLPEAPLREYGKEDSLASSLAEWLVYLRSS